MNYNVISRPKLPRNKYGDVQGKSGTITSTSLFGKSETTSSSNVEINDFIGSTSDENGVRGLVPAPKTNANEPLGTLNDNVKFLKGSGTWVDIPISRYTEENVNKDGVNLNGNFTVSDTLTANTLNVLGSAHFWELVIDKVKATGGNLLITPASFKVDFVGDVINYNVDATQSPFNVMFYNETEGTGILGLQELFTNQNVTQLKAKRLYMKRSDGDNQIVTECQIGDMVRCKTLNIDDSGSEFSNKDYWTFVLATGSEEFQGEDCLYIDVFYQYVSNGTTYGVGTTLQYNDSPTTTPVYHNNDMLYDDAYTVVIFSGDVSNGTYTYFNSDYNGSVSWDGTKWTFAGSGTDVYPGTSEEINCTGELFLFECVNDNRFSSPVLKISDKYGKGGLTNYFYVSGKYYTDVYSEDSGSSDEPLLDSFTFGYGDFNPEVGDDLVCLGHLWNAERQGALLISAYDPMDPELRAPAIAQYMGIRTFTTLSPYRTSSIAANGNTFMGKFLVNNNGTYMDIDEKLNIYTADITTGLEKVGIHLDGENSTIKLIGSTEIRQNADGEVDTLTVWDSDDMMRVKISPEAIPNKSNIQQEINPTSSLQFRNNGTSNNYAVTIHHTWTEFIWSWDHRWQYYVSTGGYIKFFQYCNIGTFQSGSKITLSNLYTSLTSRAYFKGGDKITTRSASGRTQSITDVIIRLKRKSGSSYVNVTSKTLTSGSTITVSDESATISYPNSIWDNYNVGTTGSYRIELEFVYNPYASITYTSEQSDPSIDFYNNLWSTINIVQPSASMTRIGRNGLVFNTESSGQYFYAGNDGIEMKWGDASITLDSSKGLKMCPVIETLTSSNTQISESASIVNATGYTSNTTIYLPSASTYGIGRELIIYGNDFVTVAVRYSGKILTPKGTENSITNYPSASTNPFNEYSSYSLSTTYDVNENDGDGGTTTRYYRSHTPILRLINLGTNWLKI